VRSKLHPFEEITDVLTPSSNALIALQLKPCRVQRFPSLGGQGAADGVRILARPIETMFDATRVGRFEGDPFNGGILGDGIARGEIGVDLTDCRKR
jgi:hypothetical protein